MPERSPPDASNLLKHFDEDAARRLASLLEQGEITQAHIVEIIRLTAADARYRDPEMFDSLLEDAGEMDESAFRAWVDHSMREDEG